MKKIKTYNNFINESLKDKLKGKSDDEIKNNIKNIISDIANELLKKKYFFDYNKAYKFIEDKYKDEILYLINEISNNFGDDNFDYTISYNDISKLIVMNYEDDLDANILR